MNSCDHKPLFKWNVLFARSPQSVCRECGEKIKMKPAYQIISRILNGVLIAILFWFAITGSNGASEPETVWTRMIVNIGIMIGIILLYLLLQILLFRFARYEAVPVPEAKDLSDPNRAENLESSSEKPKYTAEQLEIMEHYAAAERGAQTDIQTGSGMDEGINAGLSVDVIAEKAETALADACVHSPVRNWKNHIPGMVDFICAKCGNPITFAPAVKKTVNMLLLLVTMLILMPSFINMDVPFWEFGLLALLVLVISVAIQFFFLWKGRFVLNKKNTRKP